MSAYHRPHIEHNALLGAALRVMSADFLADDSDPNADASSEYAGEQFALAARDLAAAVDTLDFDSQPVGWRKDEITATQPEASRAWAVYAACGPDRHLIATEEYPTSQTREQVFASLDPDLGDRWTFELVRLSRVELRALRTPADPTAVESPYDAGALAYFAEHFGNVEWAVHVIGPDDVFTREDAELDDDDPANPPFTRTSAIEFAAEVNAAAAKLAAEPDPLGLRPTFHAVVLHNGAPYVPAAPETHTGEGVLGEITTHKGRVENCGAPSCGVADESGNLDLMVGAESIEAVLAFLGEGGGEPIDGEGEGWAENIVNLAARDSARGQGIECLNTALQASNAMVTEARFAACALYSALVKVAKDYGDVIGYDPSLGVLEMTPNWLIGEHQGVENWLTS
jgi:hypothetical protein